MEEMGALSPKLLFFSIGCYLAACHITKFFEQLDPVFVEITVMLHMYNAVVTTIILIILTSS
jgi:hypothetical protein